MGYKIANTLKKSKKILIFILILWVILSIVLVSPITVGMTEATVDGKFDFGISIEIILKNMTNVTGNLSKIFLSDYIGNFWKAQGYLLIALFFFALIGFLKAMPKHEYSDIEHGSSDWCSGGEQYKILNPKKGILLAEKHYLPVDKRGNTNVLVVGRIWFW